MRVVFALCVCVVSSVASRAGDTWPGWRGPTGQGHTDEKTLPLTWGGKTDENVLWKAPLPGTTAAGKPKRDLNQSSPIVWKDRVFVTAAFWPDGVAQSEFPEHHVACYSATDGKPLWDTTVKPGPWQLKDLRGGYAAPTPCTDGTRVYALFGSSVLAALDFDGKEVWRAELKPFAWDVCVGTSPVLAGGNVLVLADGTKPADSRLIAFDAKTGEVKWEKKRPDANFSHSTPLLADVGGKPQLLVAASGAVQGLNPTDGEVIWTAKNKGDVPTPVFADGLVYAENGRGGPGVAVDPTGTGDVTKTHVKWTTGPNPEGYSSPVVAGGMVYRMEKDTLRCLDLATGKKVYTERLPNGVNQAVSPVVTADGKVCIAGGGKGVVVPVGAKFEVLATNDLGDDSPASPAVAHGKLYIKGGKFLYCVGKLGK